MFSYSQDVPIDSAMYRKITDGLGSEPPAGLIVHLAIERPEGGLRYIDVWESHEACERFVEERLHPVVHALLAPIFGDQLPPEPERTPVALLHVWGAALGDIAV